VNRPVSARVTRGVKITFVSTVISGLLQIGVTMALARLLAPQDYGLFASLVAIGALSVGLVTGVVERALVVSKESQSLDGSVSALVAVAITTALVVLLVIRLGNMLGLTRIPILMLGLQLAGIVAATFSLIPRVMLRRRIVFGWIELSNLCSQALGTALISIVLAMRGWGIYALLLGSLAQSVVLSTIMLAFTPRSALWPPSFANLRHVLPAAFQLGKASSLEVAYGRMPVIVVGAMIGTVPLGFFNRAYSLVQLPIELLAASMNRVMVSGLTAVGDEPARLQRGMRSLTLIACAMLTPIICGVAGSRHAFVAVILGPKWAAAAAIIPPLAFATWATTLGSLFAVLAESTRKFREKVLIQAISTAILVVAMLVGSYFGLFGAASALALASIAFLVLYLNLAARTIGATRRAIIAWMVPGLAAGVICALYSLMLDLQTAAFPILWVFIAQIGGCGLLTLGYYGLFHRRLLGEMLTMLIPVQIRERFRGRLARTAG
jgi:lipopolysaccharide exporter